MQPIKAHTSSESLVELSIDGHKTTFVNVTQILLSLTHTPRLKWLDNPSPLHQPQAVQQTPTAPAVQPPVAPATPKQAATKSPTAATRTQRKTPATADVQPLTSRTVVIPRASHNFPKPVAILGHYLLTLGGPDNILGGPEIKIYLSFC